MLDCGRSAESVTVPASSTLVTLTVTSSVATLFVSSVAMMVTMYSFSMTPVGGVSKSGES